MKVGSLVECIKQSHYYTNDTHPIVRNIYTIRSIIGTHDVGLAFEEIINDRKMQPYGVIEEIHFSIARFKEVLPPIANIEEYINKNTLEPVLL